MQNVIEDIFSAVFDQQEIVDSVNLNLRPVLQGRKGAASEDDYFKKLSFCLGYHIRKVEALKSLIFTSLKHNVMKKKLDREQITSNVDGIIFSEADPVQIVETARVFFGETLFDSKDQRDASYLMSCMKLVVESSLLVGFIDYVSNREHPSFLSFSYDELTRKFDEVLDKYTGMALQSIMKSL